ncbi:hypothetical protein [Piscinibacter sp. HJYY11]|uniref:hypothetical protein n=1 Tax=Piscinibacter sp. HJYY11 TaxID=2801333 RepID=UPI00191F08B3|nr:hypothetical protein [Piscinibacter sp. HJYY11]MBL0728817.1 hypothetical protein [Piscinibacter sp. HJYY11]
MKTILKTLSLAAVAFSCTGVAVAQTSVGVSVQVAQPGVYGRIDIGNLPPPPVVYAKPVVIAQPAVVVPAQPVYLYVPPGHQKKWSKHCHRYNACGQPVYFVKESWVHERYEREHGKHGHKHKHHKHDKHDHPGKGHGKHD